MNVKGLLHSKSEAVQVSEKFKKREFVIQTADQYPQHIALQLSQDKCGLIDSVKIGEEINCHINLRGRLWLDPKTNIEKCFNTLEAWRIETQSTTNGLDNPTAGVATNDLPF
jgi:hypothetical protein